MEVLNANTYISISLAITLVGSIVWVVRSLNTLNMEIISLKTEKARLELELKELDKRVMPKELIEVHFKHVMETLAEIKLAVSSLQKK